MRNVNIRVMIGNLETVTRYLRKCLRESAGTVKPTLPQPPPSSPFAQQAKYKPNFCSLSNNMNIKNRKCESPDC